MKKINSIILFILILASSVTSFANQEVIKQTKKVSVVFVGTKKGFSESTFGHIALRLSSSDRPSLTDATLEFVADIPTGEKAIKKYLKGIGVVYAYPVAAKVLPFYEFKRVKQVDENRDITVIDLNLTKKEVESVKKFILDFQNNPSQTDYTFFYKNCSFFSVLALEQATGKKLRFKSLPWIAPGVLKKAGLVTNTETSLKGSDKRKEIIKREFKKRKVNLAFDNPEWEDNFAQMIASKNIVLKQSSYFKLLSILSNPSKDNKTKRNTRSLIRYLKEFEPYITKFSIKNIFKNPEQKRVIELSKKKFKRAPLTDRSIKTEFIIKKNNVALKVRWKKVVTRAGRRSFQNEVLFFNIKELKYNPTTLEITHNNSVIGYNIDKKNLDFVLTQKLDYGLDFNRQNRTITPFIYIDHSKTLKNPNLSFKEIKAKEHLALNNRKDFAGQIGSCNAMALLQKALLERVTFLPNIPNKMGTQEIKDTIIEVFNGNYAIVPGYKNIKDFTSAISKEDLKNIVVAIDESIKKGKTAQLVENIRIQLPLNQKSFKAFKALLDAGINIPLEIALVNKKSNKLESSTGHVILVHNLEKNPNGTYQISAYDPNTSINKLYSLDKNYNIHSPFFSKDYNYVGAFRFKDPMEVQLEHAIQSRRKKMNALQTYTQNGKSYLIPQNEILKMVE